MENRPLAYRMSPMSFADYIGQEHLMGENAPIRNMILRDNLRSMILYGPPGSGKTSIVRLIVKLSQTKLIKLNAIETGINEVRKAIENAKNPFFLKAKRL